MNLKLMLLASDPEYAYEAEQAGVDRIFYDLEYLGKRERQRGRNTVLSNNTVDGIQAVRSVLTKSQLLVRTNPINPYLEDEVNRCIEYGADILMLPMVVDAEDARNFVYLVSGRAKVCVMIETPQALCRIHDICDVDGVDEIFVGLNDLHIGMGLTFMFELLSGGLIEYMANIFREKEISFGFGGIAKIGEGLLPADNILGEHYRLGSQSVILSRTFKNHSDVTNSNYDVDLKKEIKLVRQKEHELLNWCEKDFERNFHIVCEKTNEVVAMIHSNSG